MSERPTKPGWYPDPYWGYTPAYRYFDGKAWTHYTVKNPNMPGPEGWYPDPDDPTNHRERWYSNGEWTERRRRWVSDGYGNLNEVVEEAQPGPAPEAEQPPAPTNFLSALAARLNMPVTVGLVLAIIVVAILVFWIGGWLPGPAANAPTSAAETESLGASVVSPTVTPGSAGTATPVDATATPLATSTAAPGSPSEPVARVFHGTVTASEENFGSGTTILDRADFRIDAGNLISLDAIWQAQHQSADWITALNPGGLYCTVLVARGSGTVEADGTFKMGFVGYTAAIDDVCPGVDTPNILGGGDIRTTGELGAYLSMTDRVEVWGTVADGTVTVEDVAFRTGYATTTASFTATGGA